MQKKVKSRLLDVLIVVLCLSVFTISIRSFWMDLNSSSTRKDKEEIATIEFKRKIAQRKFNDRVVWERLQQNSPLYDYDIIRTADDAAATVTFKDGTVLELHENTMLQVSYTEEGLQISVNDGNIEVDTTSATETKKVALSMENGSVLKLDSGSKISAVSDSGSGDNSFKLQSGNATVTTKTENGKQSAVQTITSGETVKVAASGEVRKEPLTVTSISSETKLLAFNNEKTMPVKLAWNTSDAYENKNIKIETSLTKDFSKIEKSYSVADKNYVNLQSPIGKLYWRAYPEGEIEQAASGRITVDSVKKVVAVSPAKDSLFSYRKDTELPKVSFSWQGNDYADHYKLEVSKSQDLSNPVYAEEINSTQFTVKNLSEGTYFWRVTPYYKVQSIGYGESTGVASFAIEKREELQPPRLAIPAAGGKLTFNPVKENQVTFQWKSDVKTADYKLQVSNKKDFSTLVYEKESTKTRITDNFTLESLPAGSYYWKVVRTSAEDDSPMSSEIRRFIVEKYIPGETKLIYPPENYAAESSKVRTTAFMWKLAADYEEANVQSVVQISPSLKFDRDTKEFSTEEQSLKDVSLVAGSYYWRVGVKTAGSDMTYTSPRALTVLGQLGRPAIISPAADSTMSIPADNQIKVSWTAVPEADYYKLKVYDSSEKLVAEIGSTKQTSASVPLSSAATYKCTVQAYTEETELSPRRSGKTAAVNFTLRAVMPVQLMAPANNARIQGLTALRTPTVLSWKQGDKIEKSQLVLRKLQANGTYKTVQTIDNPRNQIRLERLEPGTYKWTIKASGAGGVSLNGATNTFVITAIPELQAPQLRFPTNGGVIGADYLRENRNITFTWANVEGATEYKFVLYQKNINGTLKKLYEQKTGRATELKYKDLASLDVGEFEWNVTAYSYAPDGYEEQKGKASTGNFKIDFALPGKVQTIDPGKLYGI